MPSLWQLVVVLMEPFGHRGHPTWYEMQRARHIGEAIGMTVQELVEEGFTDKEAIAFIAGTAFQRAAQDGETWHSNHSAVRTVEHLMNGGFAKAWSIDAILMALGDINAVMHELPPQRPEGLIDD